MFIGLFAVLLTGFPVAFGLAAVGTLWAFYVLMKMGASLVF